MNGLHLRVLGLALACAFAPAGVSASERVPPGVWCGSGYWFTFDEPAGWLLLSDVEGGSLKLALAPSGSTFPEATTIIGLELNLSHSYRTDVQLDVQAALHRQVALLNAFAGPREIRPFEIRHPKLPTAGAELVFDDARRRVVVLDPLNGNGSYFVLSMSWKGTKSDPEASSAFRKMLTSIDFDPGRACELAGDEIVAVRRDAPDSSVAKPGPAKAGAGGSFDLERGASGCIVLGKLFVPVYCREDEVDGQPILLAFFDDDDGTERAETYLELFRERIATPFCYEATLHPRNAPRLVFHAENASQALLYDCATRSVQTEIEPPARRPSRPPIAREPESSLPIRDAFADDAVEWRRQRR